MKIIKHLKAPPRHPIRNRLGVDVDSGALELMYFFLIFSASLLSSRPLFDQFDFFQLIELESDAKSDAKICDVDHKVHFQYLMKFKSF